MLNPGILYDAFIRLYEGGGNSSVGRAPLHSCIRGKGGERLFGRGLLFQPLRASLSDFIKFHTLQSKVAFGVSKF